eukprot:3517590-Amphidinium_carterae.1
MAAVSSAGSALQFTAEELTCARDVVMRAVSCDGLALKYVAEALRGDREAGMLIQGPLHQVFFQAASCSVSMRVVLTAASNYKFALQYASDILLEDETFAGEARCCHYLFKVVAMSGRSCVVAVHPYEVSRAKVLRTSCEKLGMQFTNKEALLHGTDVVQDRTPVFQWPGPPVPGVIIEYQIVA